MLFLITGTTFLLFFAGPTDPARYTCARNCTPAILEGNRKALGYDQPVYVQYGKFISGLFVGRDFPDNAELRASHPEQIVHCPAPCMGYLSLIHISEPTRLGMISYAVFCLKKKKKIQRTKASGSTARVRKKKRRNNIRRT